nr:zinc knuckle CX2CX4HX4C [Tanacetum cinerariifolium]
RKEDSNEVVTEEIRVSIIEGNEDYVELTNEGANGVCDSANMEVNDDFDQKEYNIVHNDKHSGVNKQNVTMDSGESNSNENNCVNDECDRDLGTNNDDSIKHNVSYAKTMKKDEIPKDLSFIPTIVIKFGTLLVKKDSERWSLIVSGHFMRFYMHINEMRYNKRRMWSKYGVTEINANKNGHYMFKFRDKEGLQSVIEKGSWMIYGITYNVPIKYIYSKIKSFKALPKLKMSYEFSRQEMEETVFVTFNEDDEVISQSSTEGDAINFNENRSFPDDEFLKPRSKVNQFPVNIKYFPYIPTYENITPTYSPILQDSVSPEEPLKFTSTYNHPALNELDLSKSNDILKPVEIQHTIMNGPISDVQPSPTLLPSTKGKPLAGITNKSKVRDSEAALAYECMYVNFLSKMEPKKLIEALECNKS